MIDLPNKIRRHEREGEHFDSPDHPRMSRATSVWIGIGSLVVGAASAAYSADQNRKNAHQAADANKAAVQTTNDANYQRWLESQGVGPDGKPINTKLPRWMTAPAGYFGTPRARPVPTFSMDSSVPAIGALGGAPTATTNAVTTGPGSGGGFLVKGQPGPVVGFKSAPLPATSAGPSARGGGLGSFLGNATRDHLAIMGDPIQGFKRLFG